MAHIYRALAVLKLSYQVAVLITQAHTIIQAMTGNTFFANPTLLTQVETLLGELHDAEAAARRKTLGAVEARDGKKLLLIAALQALRTYVQTVADATPEKAEEIILSAGMRVRKVTPRQKNTFTAAQGASPGVVDLLAAVAAKGAWYEWEWSSDQHTWTSLTPTMQASTTVSGLTPMTTCYFRYRALTRLGQGNWSQIISFLVM